MSEVPKGYQQTKVGTIPIDWEVVKLSDIVSKTTAKNVDSRLQAVLSNSALQGVVHQNEYFDRDIANKYNLAGYFIAKAGDFIYNPRISKHAPAGPINRNLTGIDGIVSPLYTVFRLNGKLVVDKFMACFFKSSLWLQYIYGVANYGARHDRMNIADRDFFKMPVPVPSLAEQEKIVEIIQTWDEAILQQNALIQQKEDYKAGILQQLFANELGSPIKTSQWKEVRLKDILTEHGEKSDGNSEVYSVSVSKGLVNQIEHLGKSYSASDTSHYSLVKPNDIVYTKSPTGAFPYGIVKQNLNPINVIVSPLYGVFTPKNEDLGYIFSAYFESEVRTQNYLHPIVQKGAKNTISITNKTFLSKKIILPMDRDEQTYIANMLKTINLELIVLKRELALLKKQKQGLMQKLLTGQVRVQT